MFRHFAAASLAVFAAAGAFAQEDFRSTGRTANMQDLARVDEMVMVPMRDGVRLSTDVYLPREGEGPFPVIFWRTPYNYNTLAGSRLDMARKAVERGYAFVIQNERGRYYSEGDWEILGYPRTDGYDALTWIAEQPWSNGRVGTLGCSSSAEWQLALAAQDHPAHAAMVPMASGAGIGRVGPYMEQGNWYRGGIYQQLFGTWLYNVQQDDYPRPPAGTDRETLMRLANSYDLAADMPEVNWSGQLDHLPLATKLDNEAVQGNDGPFAEMIARGPNDPAWYEGGLYHDDEGWGVPALWMNSWYDVSVGPNMALYNHAREAGADREVRDNQYAVVAPVAHCAFFRETGAETIVGERSMGDVRLDYDALVFDWFDRWLKGERRAFQAPRIQYFMMGANEWRSADAWPPEAVEMTTVRLSSGGSANSLHGDGRLSFGEAVGQAAADRFIYDPMNPVPSNGGAVCCIGGAAQAGSFDQRAIEARNDVLVYTSEPLEEALEIAGPVEITLFVSSDAPDTDFHVKLVDVAPDGTAYNLADTAMRARYREGFDREVFLEDGEIVELTFTPMATANRFAAGHRIRVEITSSNFPIYARNLNTAEPAHLQETPVIAENAVHHSAEHPSRIVLPVLAARR